MRRMGMIKKLEIKNLEGQWEDGIGPGTLKEEEENLHIRAYVLIGYLHTLMERFLY